MKGDNIMWSPTYLLSWGRSCSGVALFVRCLNYKYLLLHLYSNSNNCLLLEHCCLLISRPAPTSPQQKRDFGAVAVLVDI